MILKEQIAHDLAIAYVINRHGADVNGNFSINTTNSASGDGISSAYGGGEVKTSRMPDVDAIRYVKKQTGRKKTILGFIPVNETVTVPEGHEVDAQFEEMLADYQEAYQKFLKNLSE